jgi:hypothetical protein
MADSVLAVPGVDKGQVRQSHSPQDARQRLRVGVVDLFVHECVLVAQSVLITQQHTGQAGIAQVSRSRK